MKKIHGDDFTEQINKYGDIYNLWYKTDRPDMMRNILWLIDYRQNYYTYYEELAAFGTWLYDKRQAVERGINSFEDYIAGNEYKFQKEIEEGTLEQQRLRGCMWVAADAYVENSLIRMTNFSQVEIANKLRELIPTPFIHHWKKENQKHFT